MSAPPLAACCSPRGLFSWVGSMCWPVFACSQFECPLQWITHPSHFPVLSASRILCISWKTFGGEDWHHIASYYYLWLKVSEVLATLTKWLKLIKIIIIRLLFLSFYIFGKVLHKGLSNKNFYFKTQSAVHQVRNSLHFTNQQNYFQQCIDARMTARWIKMNGRIVTLHLAFSKVKVLFKLLRYSWEQCSTHTN